MRPADKGVSQRLCRETRHVSGSTTRRPFHLWLRGRGPRACACLILPFQSPSLLVHLVSMDLSAENVLCPFADLFRRTKLRKKNNNCPWTKVPMNAENAGLTSTKPLALTKPSRDSYSLSPTKRQDLMKNPPSLKVNPPP